MLLKRLSASLPPDLAGLLPQLEKAEIRTTENLLFTAPSQLAELLPKVNKDDLDTLIAYALDATAPAAQTGDELLRHVDSTRRWTGFGLQALDELLGDWDGVGVTELAGPRKSGKSVLALHAALRCLVQDDAKVVWIDSEGSFSPIRAKSVLEHIGVEDADQVLGRLQVVPCFRLDPDFFDTIETIRREAETASATGPQLRMVVVDTVTAFFKDTLLATSAQGGSHLRCHAAMIAAMEDLAELTYDLHLTTIITNTTVSSVPSNPLSTFSASTVKPALGTAFTFCAELTLFVQETSRVFGMVDEGERLRSREKRGLRMVLEVLKSRVSPGGRWAVVETDGTRLIDVLPPPLVDERSDLQSRGMLPQRPIHGPLAQTMIP